MVNPNSLAKSIANSYFLYFPFWKYTSKGLYSLIQSYITIPNFVLYKDYLMKQCKEGRDAFNSTWKELKDAGYLIQYKERGEKEWLKTK